MQSPSMSAADDDDDSGEMGSLGSVLALLSVASLRNPQNSGRQCLFVAGYLQASFSTLSS